MTQLTSKDWANVPSSNAATPGILAHAELQEVHWNRSQENEGEIGDQEGAPAILEAQVRKSPDISNANAVANGC